MFNYCYIKNNSLTDLTVARGKYFMDAETLTEHYLNKKLQVNLGLIYEIKQRSKKHNLDTNKH